MKKKVIFKVYSSYMSEPCFEGQFNSKKEALSHVATLRSLYCNDNRYDGVFVTMETCSVVVEYDM